ncbi:MAG: hypothetical protein WC916_01540 [Candidatus Woesearchaeota archaeon]
MRFKRAAAGSAAAFIAIMTVAIIMYIMFLPPDVRENLLNDGQSGGGSSINTNRSDLVGYTSTLFDEKIGKIEYVNTKERTYVLPTSRVYAPTSPQVVKTVASAMTKNALFDREGSAFTVSFGVDTKTTKNLLLSFNVYKSAGPIVISMNGVKIYEGVVGAGNAVPIKIEQGTIQSENIIQFYSPSPGWSFWKTNTYTLSNIQIIGDVTDYTNSEAIHSFTISRAEKNNLDDVTLYFYPTCKLTEVGPLTIELNKRIIFNSVGDCGTRTFAKLNTEYILEGSNEMRFSTIKGSYMLDNMNIKVLLKSPTYRTLFFDMKNEFFKTTSSTADCGKYDGECPPGCSETKDADCCFDRNGYWCALPTSNSNNRCMAYVEKSECGLCRSGYYDRDWESPTNCEKTCGDNEDGICATNCSSTDGLKYDKDCCYAQNADNFWCQEVPTSGINDRCKASIRYNDCNLCPSGYKNKGDDAPGACDNYVDYTKNSNNDYEILNNFDTTLIVRFTNNDLRKRVTLNVNGHMINIDTTDIEYRKNIDTYVRKETNSIEIIPKEDVDITSIKVEIRRVS